MRGQKTYNSKLSTSLTLEAIFAKIRNFIIIKMEQNPILWPLQQLKAEILSVN